MEEVNSEKSLRVSDIRESLFVLSLYIGERDRGT